MPSAAPAAPRVSLPIAGETNHRTKGLLRLTMACNERCPFCNVPVEDYAVRTPPDEEITRELEAFFEAGARTLTISGGEPTLRRDALLDVVARGRAGGIPFVELQTNAVLIDSEYATELAKAGVTSAFVSLLSHVPAHHDTLCGLEGAFDDCLRGIDALVDAQVRVILNPVTAALTQTLLPDYVDFVAERLPAVRSISVSAVQPHGRASRHLDLLPDYAQLAPAIREARARAKLHEIGLVNPYCGVPLCVGWEDDPERSVEAFEAEDRRGASVDGAVGVDNRGNKSHGQPCRRCAWRTRCGGAWHAYWQTHGERGIAPPAARVEPWRVADAPPSNDQVVIADEDGLDDDALRALGEAAAPTRWWSTDALRAGEAARLLGSGCTDLALRCNATRLRTDTTLQSELRVLLRANRTRPPQLQLRVALCLEPGASFTETAQAAALAARHGCDSIALDAPREARWDSFLELMQREHPRLGITRPGDPA